MSLNNLRELRDAAGLTQTALAVMAGVSPSTISAVERYGYPPTAAMRQRLAKALHVKLEDIWPRGAPAAEPNQAVVA